MKLALIGTALGTALLATQGVAQTSCSTLAATWTSATTTLAINLTGASANAMTITLISLNQGTTPVMHGLTLGVAMPIYQVFFGVTDSAGALSASRVLANAPTGVPAYLQSVSLNMTHGPGSPGMGHHSMTFCVSNVASVMF